MFLQGSNNLTRPITRFPIHNDDFKARRVIMLAQQLLQCVSHVCIFVSHRNDDGNKGRSGVHSSREFTRGFGHHGFASGVGSRRIGVAKVAGFCISPEHNGAQHPYAK